MLGSSKVAEIGIILSTKELQMLFSFSRAKERCFSLCVKSFVAADNTMRDKKRRNYERGYEDIKYVYKYVSIN